MICTTGSQLATDLGSWLCLWLPAALLPRRSHCRTALLHLEAIGSRLSHSWVVRRCHAGWEAHLLTWRLHQPQQACSPLRDLLTPSPYMRVRLISTSRRPIGTRVSDAVLLTAPGRTHKTSWPTRPHNVLFTYTPTHTNVSDTQYSRKEVRLKRPAWVKFSV